MKFSIVADIKVQVRVEVEVTDEAIDRHGSTIRAMEAIVEEHLNRELVAGADDRVEPVDFVDVRDWTDI